MAALGWLLNLDFAGGGAAAADVAGASLKSAETFTGRWRRFTGVSCLCVIFLSRF